MEKAEQWYTHNVGNANGDWEELRDEFCLSFSSLSHGVSRRGDILAFEQLEKESICAAWARFSHLLASRESPFRDSASGVNRARISLKEAS